MKLDSARGLKSALNASVIEPWHWAARAGIAAQLIEPPGIAAGIMRIAFVAAQPMSGISRVLPTLAPGIARKAKDDYTLAVRAQNRGLEHGPLLDTIRKQAKGEVDVRYIGQVSKQKRFRPLKIGVSIGHFRITAGTLGAFVRDLGGGSALVLSNNHVLANENRARKGDAILQPGLLDGGGDPEDRIGALTRFVRLKRTGANIVDAAVASIEPGIEYDHRTLKGFRGKLAGMGDPLLAEQAVVGKVGRTTGTTKGRVVSFELDNLFVTYDSGSLRFDNQIEIEGDGGGPFSQGGDSGSLIVDGDRRALALLFAGSDHGGANGQGLTYANPLSAVLAALKVELLSS